MSMYVYGWDRDCNDDDEDEDGDCDDEEDGGDHHSLSFSQKRRGAFERKALHDYDYHPSLFPEEEEGGCV